MRVFFSYFVTVSLVLGLTACGGTDNNTIIEKAKDLGVNAGLAEVKKSLPGPFTDGLFGNIELVQDYIIPTDALFLDVRNEWERDRGFAKGSVGGAIYEYRAPGEEDRVRDEFLSEVIALVSNDLNKHIILICNSGSRTSAASEILSQNGFTNIYHIEGGMNAWRDLDFSEIKKSVN